MVKLEYRPQAYNGNEANIFVSYAHKDSDDVYPLIGQLTVDGYRVWYDGGIEPSSDWLGYITDKVIHCEYMICMISDKYVSSMYCLQELDLAISKGKKIIPVYLDEKRLDDSRQQILDRWQGIMMSELLTAEQFFEKLYLASGFKECRNAQYTSDPGYEENRRRLEEVKNSPEYMLRELLKSVKYGKIPYEAIKKELDSIVFDVREKADLIASFYKEVQEDIHILEGEENKLKARREAKKSTCQCLETYLSDMLLSADVKKVELSNRITFRHSESTRILDENAFIDWAEKNQHRDWLKYSPPKPDTNAIKKAIKSGVAVEFAEIVENDKIQIK